MKTLLSNLGYFRARLVSFFSKTHRCKFLSFSDFEKLNYKKAVSTIPIEKYTRDMLINIHI